MSNVVGYIKAGNTDAAVAVDSANSAIGLDQSVLISGEGNQTISQNMDQSALTHGLNGYQILQGSGISARGSSGSFLKFALGAASPVAGVVNGVFLLKGQGGEVYYTPLGAGVSTYTGCLRMKNIGGNRVYLAGGGQVTLYEQAGAAFVNADDTAIVTLWQQGGASEALYYATAFTDLYIGGGSATYGRGWTGTLRVGGGAQVTFRRVDANSTPPTGAVLEHGGTSRIKWCGGNITTINGYGPGGIDMSDVPAACTVTTLNCTAAFAANSIFKGRNATVTITNTNIHCGDNDTIVN